MPLRRPVLPSVSSRLSRRSLWVILGVLALLLVTGLSGGFLLGQARHTPSAASGDGQDGVISGDAPVGGLAPSASAPASNSPTPPAVSPSPSLSAGPAPGTALAPQTGSQSCPDPVWSSSAAMGTWKAGAFPVNNNVWNTSEAGPQTIYVCNSSNWYVVSNQPNLSSDQGSVKSYPSVGDFFSGTQTLGSFQNITSSYGISVPALGEWDAGYDIWTNNWGNELMIQNDTHEHPEDPAPAGSIPVTIDGIQYNALQVSSTFTVLVMNNYVTSGTVNILHVFQWLESKGWMKSTDTLTAIGYGIEISVTETSPGVQGPEQLAVTNFSLTAN